MARVLVKWNSNWADEMDISGYSIMDKEEWNDLKDTLRKKTAPFTIGVGTNEEIDYENGKELLEELEATPISKEEEDVIVRLIGGEFGFTDFAFPVDEDDEDEEYYDDEVDWNSDDEN
jgi:hypothetical protein